LFARQAELQALTERREAEVSDLMRAWKEDEVALAVSQEEVRRTSELQGQLAEQLEEERAQLVEVASRLSTLQSNLENLDRRRADVEARQQKVQGELAQLGAQEADRDRARGEVAQRVQQ